MTDLLPFTLVTIHALAVVFGAVEALRVTRATLRRARHRLDRSAIDALAAGQERVRLALMVLWVSGLGLLLLRTGWQGETFTAAMAAKVGVAVVLTLALFLYEHVVLRKLGDVAGFALCSVPPACLACVGTVSGLVAGSWLAAFALGVAGQAVALDLETLAQLAGGFILACCLAGRMLAVRMGDSALLSAA